VSEANIELFERGAAAMNARAIPDELAEELLAPGFRMENVPTAVTDKTYVGAEGVREWIKDMFEAFDDDARYETRRSSRTAMTLWWQETESLATALVRECRSRFVGYPSHGSKTESSHGRMPIRASAKP